MSFIQHQATFESASSSYDKRLQPDKGGVESRDETGSNTQAYGWTLESVFNIDA